MSLVVNAQWDTLNTTTQTMRFNAIASDDVMGQVAVGLNPATDSGDYGAIYASNDNGDTWFWIPPWSNYKDIEFFDVDYTPDGRVWIIGDSGQVILQTIWSFTFDCFMRLTPYSLRAGYAVDDSVYYCAGENGVAFRTFDRGATWDTLSSGTNETIHDIYFADAANGWIVADGGYVATTSDSGNTWTFDSVPTFGFQDFKSFAYQDTSGMHPYIVGENGTGLFSVDSGVTWSFFPTGTTNTINHIRYLNTLGGLMCGNGGYITRTTDGGGTWFTDASPVTTDLFGIAFSNDTTAFICGDSGVILRSRNDISIVHSPVVPSFSVMIYPNPTSGPLNIRLQTKETTAVTIAVMDIAGQEVQTNYYENVSAGENRFAIDVADLSAGIYIIKVQSGDGIITLPLIRQ